MRMYPATRIAAALFISAFFTACGGGGSTGDTGASGAPPAAYTGLTSQVLLTPANSAQIVAAAYGSSSGSSANPFPVSAAAARSTIRQQQETALSLRAPLTAAQRIAPAATTTNTMQGAYGGSVFVSMDASSDGRFSGTMSFNGYRPYSDVTFSGTATMSGRINTTTLTPDSYTVSFGALTIVTTSTTVTAAGTISYAYSSDGVTMTENMLVRNEATGKSSWLGNYVVTETTGGSVSITGKFYDHDYGYVDISTITPMTGTSDVPLQGEILFRGSNGSSARLVFTVSGYEIWHSDGTSSTKVSSGTAL